MFYWNLLTNWIQWIYGALSSLLLIFYFESQHFEKIAQVVSNFWVTLKDSGGRILRFQLWQCHLDSGHVSSMLKRTSQLVKYNNSVKYVDWTRFHANDFHAALQTTLTSLLTNWTPSSTKFLTVTAHYRNLGSSHPHAMTKQFNTILLI